MKALLFLLLSLLFFCCGNNPNRQITNSDSSVTELNQDEPFDTTVAIDMLREFYTAYLTEMMKDDLSTHGLSRLENITKRYVTAQLLDKINNEEELECNPFIDAQDYDNNWLKTLDVAKSESESGVFIVSFINEFDNNTKKVILLVTKNDSKYKIADILTRNVSDEEIFPYQINGYRLNAFGLACSQGNLEEVEKYIPQGNNTQIAMTNEVYEYDGLYVAVYFGQVMVTKFLIEKGENVNNVYDENGTTLLLIACRNNRIDLARILLNAGADANGAGDLGGYIQYPIVEARYNDNVELIQLLISHGADAQVTNNEEI